MIYDALLHSDGLVRVLRERLSGDKVMSRKTQLVAHVALNLWYRPHSSPEQPPSHTQLKDYSKHIQLGLIWGLWMNTLRCSCPSTGVVSAQPEWPKKLGRTVHCVQRKGLRHAHLLRQQVNNQLHMWPRGLRAHHIHWLKPAFCTRQML